MKLTIEERYSLSHVQHTFIDIYERNKWSSTRHPLEMFSELKNPNNLDISLELERFEASIKKKYQHTYMKVDQWFTTFQSWLYKTKRKAIKLESSMNQPLHVVMFNHILKRSENILSFNDALEEKYWRMWNWLVSDIDSRGVEDTGSHNKHTKEWMELVCRNRNMTAEEEKSYYSKLIKAVDAGKFDNEAFQDFIMQHNAGLMIQICDIKYPAERDKKGLDPQMLSVTNRINRMKYVD